MSGFVFDASTGRFARLVGYPPRDSDEQPKAEDPKGLSGEAMPARAGTASPEPHPEGQV